MKPHVAIVESHHQVLLYWAALRAQLEQPPQLFSLDHHTDTSLPFRSYLKKSESQISVEEQREALLKDMDYAFPQSIESAVLRLDHDEHIMTALRTDIIASAFIIAHNARDTDVQTYRQHKVMCASVDGSENSRTLLAIDCDRVLEDEFLEERVAKLNSLLSSLDEAHLFSKPYILDIDLDYLNTFRSAEPRSAQFLHRIASHAALITIAKESDHVKLCAIDKNLTSDHLLAQVLALLGTNS